MAIMGELSTIQGFGVNSRMFPAAIWAASAADVGIVGST